MRQLVKIQMEMPDLSRDLRIDRVYQVHETLVVIVKVISTGNYGEAHKTCEDSKIVITNSDKELAEKYYFISPTNRALPIGRTNRMVDSVDKIPEIQGVTPLTIEPISTSTPVSIPKNNSFFSKNKESQCDSWDESQQWDWSPKEIEAGLSKYVSKLSLEGNQTVSPSSANIADDEFDWTPQYSQ
jgi:hypothetical protein